MPDRSIFVNAYLQQTKPDASNYEIERHLVWIKRFYQGSILYPLGWNEMIDLVEKSLANEEDKALVREKLTALGITISVEWSQNNSVRQITSSNIATWGSSLRTSAETDEQLTFIEKVEMDVEDLLAGRLDDKQINRERYYPPEDYDNF